MYKLQQRKQPSTGSQLILETKDKEIAKNVIWKKKPKILHFQMISDYIEDSNKQMNERRESIQNDLPKNINVIQQGSSDS